MSITAVWEQSNDQLGRVRGTRRLLRLVQKEFVVIWSYDQRLSGLEHHYAKSMMSLEHGRSRIVIRSSVWRNYTGWDLNFGWGICWSLATQSIRCICLWTCLRDPLACLSQGPPCILDLVVMMRVVTESISDRFLWILDRHETILTFFKRELMKFRLHNQLAGRGARYHIFKCPRLSWHVILAIMIPCLEVLTARGSLYSCSCVVTSAVEFALVYSWYAVFGVCCSDD